MREPEPLPHREPVAGGGGRSDRRDHRHVVVRICASLATGMIITLVWIYRGTLGPFIGGHCRYMPTCSQYMLESVNKYGPWRGGWRGLRRVCRCHPWGGSGYDPP